MPNPTPMRSEASDITGSGERWRSTSPAHGCSRTISTGLIVINVPNATVSVAGESRDVFAQLLFSYKVNAQTALSFGYVSGANATDQSPLTQTNRTVFGKVSYAWLK
jgi:hypothetical protein